jgi:hypothetical protein
MIRSLLASALLVLAATAATAPASAQIGREHFVQADTALDAEHLVQQEIFVVLRDSTASIGAAGAKLMSDLTPSSSLAWMRARANAVTEACARTVTPLAAARELTSTTRWPQPGQESARTALLKEMTSFADELAACQKRWTVLAADTSRTNLREHAPYQMKLLQEKVDQFNRTAGTYLRRISVKLPPAGAPKP